MAKLVQDELSGFNGSAKLWETDLVPSGFVVSSAVSCAFDTGRPETMVFQADDEGNVLSWIDLAVVYAVDHEGAIRIFEEDARQGDAF